MEHEKLKKLCQMFDKAREINEENLKKILTDNKDTDYGKKYDFSEIQTYQEYCKQVPLSEYTDYECYLEKNKSLTVYPVKYVLLTSGTMGKQKKFLLTEEALKRYSSYIYQMPYCLSKDAKGNHLHASVFRSTKEQGTILSCAYYEYLFLNGYLNTDDFFGGRKFLFSDEISNVAYTKLWLGLSCPELHSIQSIFLYDLLLIFRYLEEHYEMILTDIENRQISVPISEHEKEALLNIPPLSQERLRELREIFAEGFQEPIVPRIWKQLQFVSGIDGNHYVDQTSALKYYIGETPIFYFAYASSELMAGVATEFGKKDYTILPESAFYEFLPLDSENETVLFKELEGDKEYEPVITTFSGLYRYKTGDVIKVTGFRGEAPMFEVMGRRKNLLNIAGEKIDFPTLALAIKRFAEELEITIEEFSIGFDPNVIPCGYTCFLEIQEKVDISEKADVLFDEILKELCADYEDIRNLCMLNAPRVIKLPKFSHREYKEKYHALAHNKPKAVLSDAQFDYFMKRSMEYGE